MLQSENQPRSPAFRRLHSIVLAAKVGGAARERLWKGLERFANCGDGLQEYLGLQQGYPKFWPATIWTAYPNFEWKRLDWDPECHDLFLLYRDALRSVWRNDFLEKDWGQAEFLLGVTEWKKDFLGLHYVIPGLPGAWRKVSILGGRQPALTEIKILWKQGSLSIEPQSEFQQAFYLLILQSWRARVCPGPDCEQRYFIARKPKQKFCGESCSAASRRASNLDWWWREGVTRREKRFKAGSKRNRK
jgi:hypothetical protein